MRNPFYWSFRAQFAAGFLVCAALLAYALFVQYQLGIDPCPLCSFQRGVFVLMGLFFLIGGLHGPKSWGRRIYAALVFVSACGGIAIAARHVWLQHLPKDQVPACGPGLSYMLESFPFQKTLQMVFTGSGECAEVNWVFLGLSMPVWTLISYVLLGVGALWAGFLRHRPA
jgi:protein dithiol:quinone oxidoreductase